MINFDEMEDSLKRSAPRLDILLHSLKADLRDEERKLNGTWSNPKRVAELREDVGKVTALLALETMKQNMRDAIK